MGGILSVLMRSIFSEFAASGGARGVFSWE